MTKTEHDKEREILNYIKKYSKEGQEIEFLTHQDLLDKFKDKQFDEAAIEELLDNLINSNAIVFRDLEFQVYSSEKESFEEYFKDVIIERSEGAFLIILSLIFTMAFLFYFQDNIFEPKIEEKIAAGGFFIGTVVAISFYIFLTLIFNGISNKIPEFKKIDFTFIYILIICGTLLFGGFWLIFKLLDKPFQDIYNFYILASVIALTSLFYQWVIKPTKDKGK